MSKFEEAIDLLDLKGWLEQYADVTSATHDEIKLTECPKCGNENSKLYVNTDKKLWDCKRCGWGKGLADVCILMSEVSGRHINDIKKELARTVIPTPDTNAFTMRLMASMNESVIKNKLFVAESITLPGSPLLSIEDTAVMSASDKIRNYAYSRGLTETELTGLHIRAASKLRSHSGLFMVFPILYNGIPVNYQGRRLSEIEPKYLSGNDIGDWVWPIDTAQLAWYKEKQFVVIVEGVFDALACWRIGFPAVCTFGKKITQRQVNLLRYIGINKVIIAWDPDAQADIENAGIRLKTAFDTYVADLFLPTDYNENIQGKLDPGKVLEIPSWGNWLSERLTNAFSVYSSDFYNWQLERRLM